ncbi:MAG: FAD-dependent oxidoreductase [Pyrinomonadaceae bacterium]|nr:FAD-dependent oxidoreductase [Pyrinomonadaceae bacterium]
MFDVCVIGAGPAGLSAALWCDELGLRTVVLERRDEIGGQLLWIHNRIKNHLGAQAANGREMRDCFAHGIERARFELRTEVEVKQSHLGEKRVELQNGERIEARSMIIATGLRRRILDVPGEAEFAGRGMMESAARDRELFAGRDVCVVGGGDSAVENALLLAEVCRNVSIIHRGKAFRARPQFIERLSQSPRIRVYLQSRVERITGNAEVEAVSFFNGESFGAMELNVSGVLARIGYEPNTEMFDNELKLNSEGYIAVSSDGETNVQDVFAVGDVANPLAPTISGAVGAGATAAKVISARRINRSTLV